jgi:hypothetical protein
MNRREKEKGLRFHAPPSKSFFTSAANPRRWRHGRCTRRGASAYRTAPGRPLGKWIVKRSPNPQFKWIVFEFGQNTAEDIPLSSWKEDFYPNGDLFSDSGGMQFRMNKNTLRFLILNPIGYWSYGEKSMYGKEGMLQPFMEIGKCSKI